MLPKKDPDQLIRSVNEQRPSVTEFSGDDGVLRGPELPAGEWPPQTLAWWRAWRVCAQSASFTVTDWAFLVDTAYVHARFCVDGKGATELRVRSAKFGATIEDRIRLRMKVSPQQPAVPAPVAVGEDRRERLLRAAQG